MTTGYSVGNLELSISALDKSATSLDNLLNRLDLIYDFCKGINSPIKTIRSELASISRLKFSSLDSLTNSLNGIQKVSTKGLYTSLSQISRILAPLKELTTSLNVATPLNSFANGLNKIVKLDVAGFDTQIKALTASLNPFLSELIKATPALTAFSTAMASVKGRRTIRFSSIGTTAGKGDKGSSDKSRAFNLASTIGKLYFIVNYTKRLGQFMSGLVQSAIDYTETLNLWQVAMRGNIDTAEEFITKMNKAYGIAEQTLMKYQATFRNMLSTLGGVSTDVSYSLSEYLTQMALDYASLYNTSIEKAMTVFQSVLSGQVRPIRSISGYDITENTIFQLYQELGGTKTMRQLSQTEKRLLRIYAVFQQMDRSGAIGDLNKTLNNTANQMRIMSESAKELGVWIGKMIELYISPALPYINAFIITAKNIAQAITKALPNYSEFDGTIAGYEETAEAMDEVQGKLLGFDKFRSLSGQENNNLGLGIDENLIAGLTQYQSILENVSNTATELAEKWTSWWVSDEGGLTTQAKNLLAVLKSIGIVVGTLVGYKLISKIVPFVTGIKGLTTNMKLLNSVLVVGVIASFTRAIELFKEGEIAGGILATLIGVTLVGALIVLHFRTVDVSTALFKFDKIMAGVGKTATLAVMGISSLVAGIIAISTADMGWGQRLITIFVALASAIAATAIALHAFKGDWVKSLSIAGIVAGGVLTVGSALGNMSVKKFKDGGLVEDGLFTMNKGEVMGTFDDGSSIVANNQQIIRGIKQGVYQAVSQAMSNSGTGDDRPIDIYIDGEKVFQATKKNAKRHGMAFSKI